MTAPTSEAALIDGKGFAEGLRARVGEGAAAFAYQAGRRPGLAVVLVGDDAASQVYVGAKGKACEAAGIASFEHRLPADTSEAALLSLVERLNQDEAVDGILVQLPLPGQLDEQAIIAAINPDKDVDGFHVINAGRLAVGQTGFVPCTPLGCIMLLKDRLGDLSGLDAVVIGRNEGARLVACLASLRGAVRRVVYVDSGSTDRSVDAALAAGADVVRLDMTAPFTAARARNAGLAELAKAAPDFVQLIDGDCTLDPDWLPGAEPHPRTDRAWPLHVRRRACLR